MKIVIAAGGTGGHLFPGVSIAQEFLHRDPWTDILFMGTAAGIESRVLPGLGFRLATVQVSGFKGKGLVQKVKSLASVPLSVLQAARFLRQQQTRFVLGMGGYTAFPAIAAARLLGIPCAIHEQNSVPGLANRWLSKIADRVFISYEASRPYFPAEKIIFSGMPVRLPGKPLPDLPQADKLCIFVCGGSQGARPVNEAVMAALAALEPARGRLRFIHQTGRQGVDMVREGYAARGFEAQVHPFIDDMYGCYSQAHLVVTRSGASTLAEIALSGRPSILLPYAFASGNHQEHNARAFVEQGAALMLTTRDLTGESLARAILAMVDDAEKLVRMAAQARLLAKPEAAAAVVQACLGLVAAEKSP